jgi:hypothetical protein
VIELASRAKMLPAPQRIVFDSLMDPHQPGTRPWLDLLPDEVEPRVLEAARPTRVVWSSLWPRRPDDQVLLDLEPVGSETSLRFTLRTPHEPPDDVTIRRLRYRMSVLLYAELRYSYGG